MSERVSPGLSIAITAYNEARRIGPSLNKIIEYCQRRGEDWEIVVYDDGSQDGTIDIVRQVADGHLRVFSAARNQGKGAGIRRAMLEAKGDRIIFTDADLATPIEEASNLLAKMDEGYDIAIGCRIQPDGSDMRVSQPLYRRMLGKFFHFLIWLLVLRGIKDTQSGFKCFRRDVAQTLFSQQQLTSIIFDVEILYMARRLGYRIAEVPVQWDDVGGSRMRVSAGHALTVLRDIVRIPWLHRDLTRLAAPSRPAN